MNVTKRRVELMLMVIYCFQEILPAHAPVKTAANLATKSRKAVQYNMEATRENLAKETRTQRLNSKRFVHVKK